MENLPDADSVAHDTSAGESPRARDDSELRRAIATLLPDLRAFARFLAQDRAAADDIVQDAVVRALGALDTFQSGSNPKAWLFTILRNVFFEQTRRRRTERAALSRMAPADAHAGPAQEGETELADLQRMLGRLSPVLREALVLVGAQGLTNEEAAMICSVPVSTMKARVARARGAIAAAMSGDGRQASI